MIFFFRIKEKIRRIHTRVVTVNGVAVLVVVEGVVVDDIDGFQIVNLQTPLPEKRFKLMIE